MSNLIYQTRFGGPESPVEERGNCYSACLATILGLTLAEVPNFHERMQAASAEWHEVVSLWLAKRGLWPLECLVNEEWIREARRFEWGPYVLSGRSPRGEWLHSVVGHSGTIVHDPAARQFPEGPTLGLATEEWPWRVEVLVPGARWEAGR